MVYNEFLVRIFLIRIIWNFWFLLYKKCVICNLDCIDFCVFVRLKSLLMIWFLKNCCSYMYSSIDLFVKGDFVYVIVL